jgi:hypothetical protein
MAFGVRPDSQRSVYCFLLGTWSHFRPRSIPRELAVERLPDGSMVAAEIAATSGIEGVRRYVTLDELKISPDASQVHTRSDRLGPDRTGLSTNALANREVETWRFSIPMTPAARS